MVNSSLYWPKVSRDEWGEVSWSRMKSAMIPAR